MQNQFREIAKKFTTEKWKDSDTVLSFFIGICFILLFILLSYGAIPEQTHWEVGTVASNDVLADRSLTYEDIEATEAKRQEALKGVSKVNRMSMESFNTFTLVDIDQKFDTLYKIIDDSATTKEEKINSLKESLKLSGSEDQYDSILKLNEASVESLHAITVYFASQVMNKGVTEEDLSSAYNNILKTIDEATTLNQIEKTLLKDILQDVKFYPTAVYDEAATKEKQQLVTKSVEPVSHTLKKGQTIINKGDVVTNEQYQALIALGLSSDLPTWFYALGVALTLCLTFFLMYCYARYYSEYKMEWQKTLKVFLVVSLVEVVFMPLTLALKLGHVQGEINVSGYLLPMALGVMLISYLRSQKDSIFMLLIFSIYLIVYTGVSQFVFVAILGSLAGIAQTSCLSKRGDLLKLALTIGVFNGIGVISLGLLKGQALMAVLNSLLYAFGSGFLSVVLALGILPYLENGFKITTPMTLLDLANPNQPLLKRLLQEAPGTYHHSVMVANLGEAIADELGANGLLVRAAAYYHDIGKLKRPAFFSENQFSGENAHDKISPVLSTLIITSHVKDGVSLAKKEKLPPAVIDLIAQHHGDTIVGYFYMKAKQLDDSVNASDFRYHQKKPQTKEAAILMVADTVEAAVRSRKGVTRGQISGFIRQLINGKLADGQFEECNLTFKDIDKIAEVCTKVMAGLYHKRIEYPSKEQLNGK